MAHYITDGNKNRIKVAGNYGKKLDDKLVSFVESEKLKTLNLFRSDIVQGAWYFATGNYGYATQYVCNNRKLKCKPNTTYTFKFDTLSTGISIAGLLFYKDGTLLSTISLENTPVTNYVFTTPDNCNIMCITFWKGSHTATITPNEIVNVMLYEGSENLDYIPYSGEIIHRAEMVKAFTPSGTYEDIPLTLSSDGATYIAIYTAPANGYIAVALVTLKTPYAGLSITPYRSDDSEDFTRMKVAEVWSDQQNYGRTKFLPVKKGDRVQIGGSNVVFSWNGWNAYCRFYYAEGEI